MKLPLPLTAILLTSCTTTFTKTEGGAVAFFNTLGGDHQGVTVTPTGTHIESMKHSESFKNGTKAIEKVMIAKSLASVARNKDNQTGATDRTKAANSTARHNATTNAGIAANNNAANIAITESNNATRIASETIQAGKEVDLETIKSIVPTE